MITKAVLLAAGRGTRMRNLTDDLPKPMLPVRGRPVLQHIVEGLAGAGVTDFLIVVGWRAEVVQEHFGEGKDFQGADPVCHAGRAGRDRARGRTGPRLLR